MKKNILEEHVKDELIQRVERLTESSPAVWGTMNATEMMHHLKQSLVIIMGAEPSDKTSTLKQKIFKQFMLHVIPKYPKGAKAPHSINMKKSNIQTNSFESEKEGLHEKLELFIMQQNIHAVHPYFGILNRKEWGIFTWMHLDHHLRQFGV